MNQPVYTQPMVQQPVYTQPVQQPILGNINNSYEPTDLYARERGKVKATENTVRTDQRLEYVDPITGQ